LDSIIRIPELIKKVKELGMSSCAITDHGSCSGLLEFYKECKKEDIKPLLGCEIYCSNNPDNSEKMDRDNYHLILLAQNEIGLKNLYWLSSNAYINNFYYKPRVWLHHLETHNEGLISSSACLGSQCSKLGLWDKPNQSYTSTREQIEFVKYISNIFKNRFYLELQDHNFWEQHIYNEVLLDIGKRLSLPFIITTDAHYLNKEDYSTHKVVLAQQLKKTLKEYEASGEMVYGDSCYVRPPDEMMAAAKKWNCEEAYHNTLDIASQCNIELVLNQPRMPSFDYKKEKDYNNFLTYTQNGVI
jgi:DNA polymerase III subunit alpha